MKGVILKSKEYFGVIIFFIILIVLSWITVSEIEINIKNDVENSLTTVLNTTQIAFKQWKTRKESEILMFSKDERVLDITKRLLKVDQNQKSLIQSREQKEIRNYFGHILQQFGYIGFFVIAKDSISLASMRDENVGITNFIYHKRGEILKEVWDGKIKYIPPISSDVPLKSLNGELVHGYPTMFFAAPISNEKNEVIAIFTLRIDVFQDFTSIAKLGRIGESGETYAVDKDGWLITRSRFAHQLVKTGRISKELLEIGTIKITDPGGNTLKAYRPEVAFNKLPLTVMAGDVTSGNSNSNVEGYRDYRGVTVYGTWYWDDELGIGVTTEIDEEEAMSTFQTIKYAIIILISISLILTSFMLFVLNRTRKKSFDQLKKAHDKLEAALEKLRESEASFNEAQRLAKIGSWELDLTTNKLIWSDEVYRIFGLKPQQFGATYEAFLDNIHPDDREFVINAYAESVKNKTPYDIIHRLLLKDGTIKFVNEYCKTFYDDVGKAVRSVGTVQDITERKKTEIALKVLNEFNKSLIESIPFSLDIVDLEGNILFMNNLLKDAVGLENPKGKCWEFYKDNGKQCTECPLKDEMKLGETNICEIHNVFGGREFEITHTVMNYKNQKALLEVFRDITESKKAQKEILKLSRGVEQSPAMVVITDTDGNIEFVNPKVTEVTGYSKEELIGKNTSIFQSGKTPKKTYEELWGTILKSETWKGELLNKRKNGELYWAFERISPILNNKGEIINYISIKEDITEKIKTRNELIEAKERAEDMNRIKSSFYANMSHELRTPLVGILGFSEIIKEESDNEELKQFGSMIYSSAFRLKRTLNTILDFSKIEENKFKLDIEEINVNILVQNEFDLSKIEAEKKQLDYRLIFNADSILIKTDKRLLGTIICHIIDNAIKYTDKGFVEVNVSLIKEEDAERLIIDVKDSGKGIKKKQLDLIWEEFRQASEGLARKYEGVGLGLSIVKKFVGLLNGSVDVKSEFGKGSSFCVKIPLFFDPNGNVTKTITVTDKKKENRTADKEKVILVVEDEKINAIAITKFLDKTYSIEVASTPEVALEMCKLNNYALILMDINLKSDMDGIELMRELKRKSQTYKDIPFVAQTAYAMISDKKRIMNSGFNDYIAKPYTRDALLEIVEKNLMSPIDS